MYSESRQQILEDGTSQLHSTTWARGKKRSERETKTDSRPSEVQWMMQIECASTLLLTPAMALPNCVEKNSSRPKEAVTKVIRTCGKFRRAAEIWENMQFQTRWRAGAKIQNTSSQRTDQAGDGERHGHAILSQTTRFRFQTRCLHDDRLDASATNTRLCVVAKVTIVMPWTKTEKEKRRRGGCDHHYPM